jgi:hypothetical protein
VKLDFNDYMSGSDKIENLYVEFELMNPTIKDSTFNIFVKYGKEVATQENWD